MKRDSIIAPITVGKLMSDFTNMKISRSAKVAAAEILEKKAKEITELAIKLANNEGRKTVKKKDIIFALEQLKLD